MRDPRGAVFSAATWWQVGVRTAQRRENRDERMRTGKGAWLLPPHCACAKAPATSLVFKSGASRARGRRLGGGQPIRGERRPRKPIARRGGWLGPASWPERPDEQLQCLCVWGAAPAAMLQEHMQEMEEVSRELLQLLAAGGAGNLLRRRLDKQEKMCDKLLETQRTAAQLVKDLLATEEKVAQKVLTGDEELQSSLRTAREMEEALRRAREEEASLRADSSALRQELEELQAELGHLQAELGDDAGLVNSATYIAQLYYKISRIDWDYECEPPFIEGIHHGPAIAQPISIDSRQHSKCFVSDYLWSLVDAAW